MNERFALRDSPVVGETPADYRRRMELLQAEALERREQDISEQRSPLNSAAERIRIWERRHQLSMPRSPDHALVSVIALNTGLSIDEVQGEQKIRAQAQAQPRVQPV